MKKLAIKKNIISNELQLICQKHKNKTIIKDINDFKKVRYGGCTQKIQCKENQKYHNQFMLNFYTTTKAKFINETRREIGLNKERLIYPIMIYVKIFPCIEEGISYIGLIQKTTFNGLTKGPRHTERSNNIGYIMTTLDDKLIHYNNVIESKFGLVPNLMYDDTKDKT